ncbi:MAG: pyruvate kinase [Bacteroidetes bacterium]|nr:pyruvate kinase [Bacteroidota bacterium]
MNDPIRRTKIIATIGPASNTPEMIRKMISAGMNVARLNFSHGSYDDHAKVITYLRSISDEMDTPVTLLQDLQGPKIRVGKLPGDQIQLTKGDTVRMIPLEEYTGLPGLIPIDYPHAAEEAVKGMSILLDDGLLSLEITGIQGNALVCKVVDGGILKNRKGVNFPNLKLKLPSLTDKDKQDLMFGLEHGVDWVSLSFVRSSDDIVELRDFIIKAGYRKPLIAKIEKPQAIEHLDAIIEVTDGVMVARGDLGVEMSPEKVPLLQKRIIEQCNRMSKPVITATQMLESMIHEPRPTRAEANDVANAIIDGTDCTMLSGESAVGEYPVKAVEMMNRIAIEVESNIEFRTYPAHEHSEIGAICEAVNRIEKVIAVSAIAVLTSSGRSAKFIAAGRPKAPIYALTDDPIVYHGLNLLWGIHPILIRHKCKSFDEMILLAETNIRDHQPTNPGEKIIVIAGIPPNIPGGTNCLKIHTL